jgi:hypothetical protein
VDWLFLGLLTCVRRLLFLMHACTAHRSLCFSVTSSQFEQGVYCETFHSEEGGWRNCETCARVRVCACMLINTSRFFAPADSSVPLFVFSSSRGCIAAVSCPSTSTSCATPVGLTVPSVLATPVLPWYVLKIHIVISYSTFLWEFPIIVPMRCGMLNVRILTRFQLPTLLVL